MTYTNVDPFTKKVKEYKNLAEWLADVEKATAGPKAKPVGKMSFPEASKRLREEFGIDLRSQAEKEQEKIDGLIERKVAAGVSAALARQQATQSTQARQEVHATRSKCSCHIASQSPTGDCHHQKPPKTTACGCSAHAKHFKEGKDATHSAYATGPVMGMERVSWPEAQRRLKAAGIEI